MNKTVHFPVVWFRREYPLHPTEVFIKKYDLTSYFDDRQIGEFVSRFEAMITDECRHNILKEYTRALMELVKITNHKYKSFDNENQTVLVETNIDELTVLCKEQMNETDIAEKLSIDLWNAYIGQIFCKKQYMGIMKAAVENCDFVLFKNNEKFDKLIKDIKDELMQDLIVDIRKDKKESTEIFN